MLNWKFENEQLAVENTVTGQVLFLGGCSGLDGRVFAAILNVFPALSLLLVPPHFLLEAQQQEAGNSR